MQSNTKPIVPTISATKNPDAYFRRYESQIILYGEARRMLEQAGLNLKGLNIEKLKTAYHTLEMHKKPQPIKIMKTGFY